MNTIPAGKPVWPLAKDFRPRQVFIKLNTWTVTSVSLPGSLSNIEQDILRPLRPLIIENLHGPSQYVYVGTQHLVDLEH